MARDGWWWWWGGSLLTCSPQGRPLLVVGVEVLGEGVRLQQAVQQLKEVRRGHVTVHALVGPRLPAVGLRLIQGVPLPTSGQHSCSSKKLRQSNLNSDANLLVKLT